MKFLIAILLLTPVLAHAKWKPNPADYPVTIHVRSSSIVIGPNCHAVFSNYCGPKQQLDVIIDGKKFMLASSSDSDTALMLGDYHAKLLDEDAPNKDNPPKSYEYHQKYEFLFPDGDRRKYVIVGASE